MWDAGLLHRVSAIWREKIHEGSVSVRDGLREEAFSLAWGTGWGFWSGGLAQLKGWWGSFTLKSGVAFQAEGKPAGGGNGSHCDRLCYWGVKCKARVMGDGVESKTDVSGDSGAFVWAALCDFLSLMLCPLIGDTWVLYLCMSFILLRMTDSKTDNFSKSIIEMLFKLVDNKKFSC